MAVLPKTDILIVGFGLVGSAVAAEIVKATNLNIVALERGPFRDTFPDFIMDHFDEWRYGVQGQLFQDLSVNTVTFRNNNDRQALPMRELGSFLPGNGVGGAAVHWNGQSWRILEHQLNYRSHLEERYGPDYLPEDTTIQDWPLSFAELEPYFDTYEKVFGIAGKAGNLNGVIQDGGNPFEGPRSSEYPQAPGVAAYNTTLFRDAAISLGYKPFPGPSGNSPGAYTNPDGQSLGACNYCGHCERFGCHVGAKASPLVTTVPVALGSGRVELRSMSTVMKVNLDSDGTRAVSVTYVDAGGVEQTQPADVILLSAWTLENVRLMLLSGIGQPYDPIMNTGVVGRNYTYQTGGANANVWFEDRIFNRFMGNGANAISMDEFHSDNFDHTDLGFFGGGNISSSNTGARPILQLGQLPPGTPTWGSEWKAAVRQYYDRQVGIAMQGESPSYRQNYADLDPTYKDQFGQPLLRITFDYTENEQKMIAWAGTNVIEPLAKAMGGSQYVVNNTRGPYNIVPYQSTHVQGGTVMGSDPTTSVVNQFCQSWDVPNVFVTGASNFPQNVGYNPTGIVGALAYSTADAIINRYLPAPGALA